MNFFKGGKPGFALALAAMVLGASAAYAVPHPSVFSSGEVTHPNGIVATPSVFLVSSQDQFSDGSGGFNSLIYSLDNAGNVIGGGPFATITKGVAQDFGIQEVYLAAAPGTGGGWTVFDIYACRGNKVFKIPAAGGTIDGAAPFATLTGAVDRQHCGITFDKEGTSFNFDMIVTTEGGNGIGGAIYRVTSAGGPSALFKQLPFVADPPSGNVTEGPSVAPTGFSGASGQLLFTQEDNPGPPGTSGTVFAVTSGGTVAAYATLKEPESIHIVPRTVCDYGTTGGGFFTTDFFNDAIIEYPSSDFAGLNGNAMVPIEFTSAGDNIKMIAASNGAITDFDPSDTSPAIVHEGSIFVECGPAVMPIIKHSSDPNVPPVNSDFIFGLYPRSDGSFSNPPVGTATDAFPTAYSYTVNTDSSPAGAIRGTLITTPPENNLQIPLSTGTFYGTVCELKHTGGWTFSTWTVTFNAGAPPGNSASAPFHPVGETVDSQIMCVNLTIVPGTANVQLDVTDTPPIACPSIPGIASSQQLNEKDKKIKDLQDQVNSLTDQLDKLKGKKK